MDADLCVQVIVGSVVTRSPNSNMASTALIELGLAVNLFEKTAVHSHRARIALVCLVIIQSYQPRRLY